MLKRSLLPFQAGMWYGVSLRGAATMDCDLVKAEATRALDYLERALEVVDELSLPACIGASIEDVIQLIRSECPELRA